MQCLASAETSGPIVDRDEIRPTHLFLLVCHGPAGNHRLTPSMGCEAESYVFLFDFSRLESYPKPDAHTLNVYPPWVPIHSSPIDATTHCKPINVNR